MVVAGLLERDAAIAFGDGVAETEQKLSAARGETQAAQDKVAALEKERASVPKFLRIPNSFSNFFELISFIRTVHEILRTLGNY